MRSTPTRAASPICSRRAASTSSASSTSDCSAGRTIGEQPAKAVRWYLERGANPNWMPPNGITVLEHAIVRYHERRVRRSDRRSASRPRRALWIAAGLGDVAGVESFIAGKGRLTAEGRQNRPDLIAMGARFGAFPPNHEADDLEIMWEAFQIAAWNGRGPRWMRSSRRACPSITRRSAGRCVLEAVGNLHDPARGVSRQPRRRPRSRVALAGPPTRRARSRGLGVEDHHDPIRREGAPHARDLRMPERSRRFSRKRRREAAVAAAAGRAGDCDAMQLAADDAARQGQSAVTTENMLIGAPPRRQRRVRGDSSGLPGRTCPGCARGSEIGSSRTAIRSPGQELPADALAEAALRWPPLKPIHVAQQSVSPFHLLFGIVSQETGPGTQLLREVGATDAQLRQGLQRLLEWW